METHQLKTVGDNWSIQFWALQIVSEINARYREKMAQST